MVRIGEGVMISIEHFIAFPEQQGAHHHLIERQVSAIWNPQYLRLAFGGRNRLMSPKWNHWSEFHHLQSHCLRPGPDFPLAHHPCLQHPTEPLLWLDFNSDLRCFDFGDVVWLSS